MIPIPPSMRLTLFLGFAGALLAAFSFQAVADGKTGTALESGGVGVLLVVAAFLHARGTWARRAAPRQRGGWERLTDER